MVRIRLDWSLVAPDGQVRPSGFDSADPSDPAYRWGYIEDAVRDAARKRLDVVLVVRRAPAWAEGPGRPTGAPAGAWQPDPAELGAFVRAAARRFSGFYPDPKDSGDGLTRRGESLPRVRFWQIWEAPNGGATLQPVKGAADHYRRMLSAASSALRRVSGRNVVVTGGTTDRGAIAPLAFWQQLLCLSRSGRRYPCPGKARFDVAAHDPVSQFGTTRLRDLQRLLARAARLRTVRPARRKPLWLTRIGWDTPPQNPRGVTPARQARLLSKALYVADRAGVALVAWNGLQDQASYLPGFPPIASGLFFNYENDLTRDTAKPAFRAYHFPFVVTRATAWGVAPRPGGAVRLEKRRGRGWRRVSSAQASRSGEFTVRLRGPALTGLYRARQAGVRSLAWRR